MATKEKNKLGGLYCKDGKVHLYVNSLQTCATDLN